MAEPSGELEEWVRAFWAEIEQVFELETENDELKERIAQLEAELDLRTNGPVVVRVCAKIVDFGSGDRYSHTYCDYLPQGHSGRCSSVRNSERMGKEWHDAYVREAKRQLTEL